MVTVQLGWSQSPNGWRSNAKQVYATVTLPLEGDDHDIAEECFVATNTAHGLLWTLIEPALPPERTHTALSVGDTVSIDGRAYRCDRFGWTRT